MRAYKTKRSIKSNLSKTQPYPISTSVMIICKYHMVYHNHISHFVNNWKHSHQTIQRINNRPVGHHITLSKHWP